MASHLKNVAIVGAGGRMGGFIVDALIKQGKHNVTAITREGSTAEMPDGLTAVKRVDYESHDSLVLALRGQDVLVITMGVMAPADTQQKLVRAAADAGLAYVVPNEWGGDETNARLREETGMGSGRLDMRRYIEEVGHGGDSKLRWISIGCGFWYEFSLGGTESRYGFDFAAKRLTLFDDGSVKTTHSTWPQVALALARVLALPVSGASPSLGDFDDSAVLIESFHISQRDMFDSVLRVTGDKESDWTVTREGSHERWQRAKDMRENGDMIGFVRQLYTRTFFPDDPSDFHDKVQNKLLGLPEESLDEATKIGIQIAAESGNNPFATKPLKR